MPKNLYTYENVMHILQIEERKGRLNKGTYSAESGIPELSKQLKELRAAIKVSSRLEANEKKLVLSQFQHKYKELTGKEHDRITKDIVDRKFSISISPKTIKGKTAYVSDNCPTTIISKIIAQELQRGYKIKPQNRDHIIEQLLRLLDGSIEKIVIRADVQDFFESIPQETLLRQLSVDGNISTTSFKHLRAFMHHYDESLRKSNQEVRGIPRGLPFSSYLAEVYMMHIDAKIREIPGVYYYKRYVDDIVIVANPDNGTTMEYWQCLEECFAGSGLTLHQEKEKKYAATWGSDTSLATFVYLGYMFLFNKGKLQLRLSPRRYQKYKILLNAIFDIYAQCSHYRTCKVDKDPSKKRMDALHQLFLRLRVLTGNGLLSGRKNYVASGVYYSNKYITTTQQLRDLDALLTELVDTRFNPPQNLFGYSAENSYDENVTRIREQLKEFSFVRSFQNKELMRNPKYNLIQTQLQGIYLKHVDE